MYRKKEEGEKEGIKNTSEDKEILNIYNENKDEFIINENRNVENKEIKKKDIVLKKNKEDVQDDLKIKKINNKVIDENEKKRKYKIKKK